MGREAKSMNGPERARENYAAFEAWVFNKIDADFREIVMHGHLNRGEICRECGFGRSALTQNPRIKAGLRELESRAGGILPALTTPDSNAVPLRARGQLKASTDAERLKALECEIVALKAANAELRARLKRFESMDNLLKETGRLAR
jgi:hypothetical protein